MTNEELIDTLNKASASESNIALQMLLRLSAERIEQLSSINETPDRLQMADDILVNADIIQEFDDNIFISVNSQDYLEWSSK